jgi:hypothetical protein
MMGIIAPARPGSADSRAVPSGYDDFPNSSPAKAVFVYWNYSFYLSGTLRIRPQNFIPPHYITCGSVIMEWQWHTIFSRARLISDPYDGTAKFHVIILIMVASEMMRCSSVSLLCRAV